MQKIIPCIWLDNEAQEASEFYSSVFSNVKINKIEKYLSETPSNKPIGSVMTIEFQIDGYKFLLLNGGTYFKPNPSISFHYKCKSVDEVDKVFNKLSDGGKVMMGLGRYPFSDRYGWVEDKYGVSWQIIFVKEEFEKRITPVLMFTKEYCGKAREAIESYSRVFNSEHNVLAEYNDGEEPDKKGTIKYSQFKIGNQEFGAMDSARMHNFIFSEGISLIINCKNQEEIDYFYDNLSAFKDAEVCGWLKDKYGVSWQLVTEGFEKLMSNKEVFDEVLKMKRIDVNRLKEIYEKTNKNNTNP